MSDLRRQLDDLKRTYAAAKYPGNLADDVLSPRGRGVIFRIVAASSILTGMAAAIAVWVATRPAAAPSNSFSPEVVVIAPATQPADVAMSDLPSLPALPGDVSLTPSAATLDMGGLPSMPSMPSLSFDENIVNTSTTKESV